MSGAAASVLRRQDVQARVAAALGNPEIPVFFAAHGQPSRVAANDALSRHARQAARAAAQSFAEPEWPGVVDPLLHVGTAEVVAKAAIRARLRSSAPQPRPRRHMTEAAVARAAVLGVSAHLVFIIRSTLVPRKPVRDQFLGRTNLIQETPSARAFIVMAGGERHRSTKCREEEYTHFEFGSFNAVRAVMFELIAAGRDEVAARLALSYSASADAWVECAAASPRALALIEAGLPDDAAQKVRAEFQFIRIAQGCSGAPDAEEAKRIVQLCRGELRTGNPMWGTLRGVTIAMGVPKELLRHSKEREPFRRPEFLHVVRWIECQLALRRVSTARLVKALDLDALDLCTGTRESAEEQRASARLRATASAATAEALDLDALDLHAGMRESALRQRAGALRWASASAATVGDVCAINFFARAFERIEGVHRLFGFNEVWRSNLFALARDGRPGPVRGKDQLDWSVVPRVLAWLAARVPLREFQMALIQRASLKSSIPDEYRSASPRTLGVFTEEVVLETVQVRHSRFPSLFLFAFLRTVDQLRDRAGAEARSRADKMKSRSRRCRLARRAVLLAAGVGNVDAVIVLAHAFPDFFPDGSLAGVEFELPEGNFAEGGCFPGRHDRGPSRDRWSWALQGEFAEQLVDELSKLDLRAPVDAMAATIACVCVSALASTKFSDERVKSLRMSDGEADRVVRWLSDVFAQRSHCGTTWSAVVGRAARRCLDALPLVSRAFRDVLVRFLCRWKDASIPERVCVADLDGMAIVREFRESLEEAFRVRKCEFWESVEEVSKLLEWGEVHGD